MLRPPLVDTHCHLGDAAFDRDRAAVLARAAGAGVSHIVVIGESVEGSARATALVGATPGLSATAGLHPHESGDWNNTTSARLRKLIFDPRVVAVGETGLDYHYLHSPKDVQRVAFETQLGMALESGKPVVVHARAADADMAAMLRSLGTRPPVVVLHSFSSGEAVWEAGMAVGAYFSFSGMITFKNWTHTARLTACPPDRLLLETDAPFLAPEPHRGKRNEPAFVREVAQRAAALRAESWEAVVQRTGENAQRCFGPRLASTL